MLLLKTNKLAIALSLILSMKANIASAANSEQEVLSQFLTEMTLGNDSFYNRVISPAKSLNRNQSDSARTEELNAKLSYEISTVLTSFNSSTEQNKLNSVKSAVNRVDSKIISNGGANMQIINGTPSAGFSRIFMMIEKKSSNQKISAEQLLNSLSSYKRSAIPSVYVYEYSSARNITQSQVTTKTGSNSSWKLPQAAPAIASSQDLVLKKCRELFGWKCVTSLYKTGELAAGTTKTKYLYAGIYDLKNNPDHQSFSRDKRSYNQITGSTAFYAITESTNWIMLYGVDSQWNEGSISFAGLIQNEYQKDVGRIKERIATDMHISQRDLNNQTAFLTGF